MSDNWIVANLENAFSAWNDKMAEIWSLITTSPQNFKGGTIWNVISGINGGLGTIGLGLLVLFLYDGHINALYKLKIPILAKKS